MNIKTNKKFKLDLDSDKIDKAWKSAIRSEGGMIITKEDLKLVSDAFKKGSDNFLKAAGLMKHDDETDEEFKTRVKSKHGMINDKGIMRLIRLRK